MTARRPIATASTAAFGAITAAAICGYYIAGGYSLAAPLALGVLLLLAAAADRYGVAAPLAATCAVALGSAPFIPPRDPVMAGLDVNEAAILFVAVLLVYANSVDRWRGFSTLPVQITAGLSGLSLMWWVSVLARSAQAGIPLDQAAKFGRAFLFLPLLTPLFAGAMADPSRRRRFLLSMGVITGASATFEVLVSLDIASLDALVHSSQTFAQEGIVGVQRIYTEAGDTLIPAGFTFGLGAALLGRTPALRRGAALVALICVIDVLLSLGRAKYVGLAGGTVAALAVWWGTANLGVRASRIVASLAAIVVVAAFLPASPLAEPARGVSDRISSLASDVGSDSVDSASGTNTVAYRKRINRTMHRRLSNENAWVQGLGFLSPTSSYDPSLPLGSIYNSDVGYTSSIMLVGLIGTLLLYAMLAYALLVLWGARHRGGDNAWIIFGSFAFILYAVLSSGSLVVLFGPPGALVTAAVLGIGLAASSQSAAR